MYLTPFYLTSRQDLLQYFVRVRSRVLRRSESPVASDSEDRFEGSLRDVVDAQQHHLLDVDEDPVVLERCSSGLSMVLSTHKTVSSS